MISVWIKPDSSDICILNSKYGITFVPSSCLKKQAQTSQEGYPFKKVTQSKNKEISNLNCLQNWLKGVII